MSLNKTLIDKAEVTWQFKENDQGKVFIGQIDIFCQFGCSRQKTMKREGVRKSSTTRFLSIQREAVKIN